MAIGNHTTWIIVDLHTARALTPPNDQRQALRFVTKEAAVAAMQRFLATERARAERCAGSYDLGRYLVVELPA